ncbi:hypothetical protein PUN28_003388 [Cardiocondyla obscurior]|uniref:Uncharacterized protein n=1 Tax=Cardiocondyla obscurior TaxID=286306 RepID=A0AAW2GNR4_9HYME
MRRKRAASRGAAKAGRGPRLRYGRRLHAGNFRRTRKIGYLIANSSKRCIARCSEALELQQLPSISSHNCHQGGERKKKNKKKKKK